MNEVSKITWEILLKEKKDTLKSLKLRSVKTGINIELLKDLKHLEELEITYSKNVPEMSLEALFKERKDTLKILKIYDTKTPFSMEPFKHLQKLEELEINWQPKIEKSISKMHTLKRLTIYTCHSEYLTSPISKPKFISLFENGNLENLEKLVMVKRYKHSGSADNQVLKTIALNCPKLQHLQFDEMCYKADIEGIKWLLKYLPKLSKLILNNCSYSIQISHLREMIQEIELEIDIEITIQYDDLDAFWDILDFQKARIQWFASSKEMICEKLNGNKWVSVEHGPLSKHFKN